jgi:hypothetical protein
MFNKIYTFISISIQKKTFTFHEIVLFDMYVYKQNIVNSNVMNIINTKNEHKSQKL